MAKISICIPVYLNVPDYFFVNFVRRMQELSNKHEFKILSIAGQPTDRMRNKLVVEALKDNPDYIMFIDSDIIFPVGAIDNLIKMDKDISSGLYFSKSKPHVPMIMKLNEDGTHSIDKNIKFNEIKRIDATGLGFCLIKAEIFKKIKYPWFKFEWRIKDGKEYQIGEDLSFFDKVKKAGYSVYLNTGIICPHYGIPLEAQHYIFYKEFE